MASSASYDDLQYNLAAQGHRQPGSTFKTFVLTAAINAGIDPYSTYYTSMPLELDLPEWGHWSVSTYSGGYSGSMDIASATIASDNTVYAQLDLDVGPEEVAETAKKMGIQTELDGIPAEGLGGLRIGVSPLEMASAYATLADGGIYRKPTAIRKVDLPRRPRQPPHPGRAQARSAGGRRLRGHPDPARQHDLGHGHRGLHRLLRPGRQDRHDRQLHRRLVRRLPAQCLHRGLGRLPRVQ